MAAPRQVSPPLQLTVKLCVAGDFQVGKTSLVRRFVSDTFDEAYLMTLGAKVSSRRFAVTDPDAPGASVQVGASIWDIMGNPGFRELLKDAYFFNTKGVLLVCDATRKETLGNLSAWHREVASIAGEIPIVVLLNKTDLTDETVIRPEDVEAFCAAYRWRWLPTSAKTGENVPEAFSLLAQEYLGSLRAAKDPPGA